MGMADGYAQASGTVGHANLHTAPGVGNAMGGIFNAQANHSPLLVTAGQQVRPHVGIQANLTNRDAIRMPHPLVKSSFEPARAADVPHALARAIHLAATPPKGPAFVSIPMDDWEGEADPAPDRRARSTRMSPARPRLTRTRSTPWPTPSRTRERPVMIAGPDIDASGAWDLAVAVRREAEPSRVSPSRPPAAGRLGFPEGHPNFRGTLPPGIAPVADTLKGYDLIIVVGSSVFPYYPYLPGEYLPEGRRAGPDHLGPRRGCARPDGPRGHRRPAKGVRAAAARRFRSRTATPATPCPTQSRARSRARSPAPLRCTPCARPSQTTASSCSKRPRRRSRCGTSSGSRARALTSSAPEAAWVLASPRRWACRWPSRTVPSSA